MSIALTLRREERARLKTRGQQGGAISASNAREGPTTHVPNGAPDSSHMAIQPQQPVSLGYSLQPLTDNSGHTYEPSQARSPWQSGPRASPCSARQSLETQAPPPHGNSENNEPFHGGNTKRQKTQGTSGAEPGRDMPSWEDQPHHRAQQVIGDIVQRQNHGADNISSTQLICKHPKCRNKIKRYSILSQLEQHIWFHSKRRQRECTCHNGGPASRQEFESHLQQGKCQQRDPKRTPPDIEGMRVYGCIKDGTEFAFDSADALR